MDQKWMAHFLMVSTCSITMQSLGKIVQHVPAVGAKMWCLFFGLFVCWSCSESRALCDRGWIVRNKHCISVYRPISLMFSAFFQKALLFQMHYTVLIFTARWRHNFCEIAVKNCEKSKNWQKSLCIPLCTDSWEIWRKFHCSNLGPRM